ncbi:hypothetical protein S40288_10281 [Stachybotrys chartarum IBT 40288]|nr:hypothetical protein S40288_10281 [Stachybotrys chartarum IBT 40288]
MWAAPIEKHSSSLPNSIAYESVILGFGEMHSDTTYLMAGDGIAYDINTPFLQTIPGYLQSDMPGARIPANSMSEANSKPPAMGDLGVRWQESTCHNPVVEEERSEALRKLALGGTSNFHSRSIKPTASKKRRQNIDEADQIENLWRNCNGIRKAMHNISKLGDQLQSWNKYQMNTVQEIPKNHSEYDQKEARKDKMHVRK